MLNAVILRMNEPHLLVADIEAMADGRVGIDVTDLIAGRFDDELVGRQLLQFIR